MHREEQLRLARQTGARGLEALAFQGLGQMDRAAGDLAVARQRFASSLRLSRSLGQDHAVEATRLEEAATSLAGGNSRGAAETAGDVADWAQGHGAPVLEARAQALRALALARERRLDEAGQSAARARLLSRQTEDRELVLAIAPALALVRAARGENREVLGELRQALAEAEKAGLVAASLEIRLAVGLIEVEWGDAATGSQTLEAVRQEAMARGFRGLTQRSSGPAADAFARSGAGREL